MRQLDDLGYEFHAKWGIILIIKDALMTMKVEKIATNLYILHGRTYQEAKTFVIDTGEELTMRSYHKLGHISEKGLKILFGQKLLPRLKNVSLPFWDNCVIKKHHRLRFSKFTTRGKNILDLVHYNVWESPITFLRGTNYLILFVDDFSRR